MAWDFDAATSYEIRDFGTGWGLSTLNDASQGSGNLQTDEAFLLTFDPSNLNADARRGVLLEWGGSLEGGEFIVERAPSGSGSFAEIVRTENHQYTDDSAVVGQTYVYRVRSVNAAGATAWSNTATITR